MNRWSSGNRDLRLRRHRSQHEVSDCPSTAVHETPPFSRLFPFSIISCFIIISPEDLTPLSQNPVRQ